MFLRIFFICSRFFLSVLAVYSGTSQAEQTIHRPQEFLKSIANEPAAGEKIYQEFCALCHAEQPMIQVNAPRIGIKDEWSKTLEKSLDEILMAIDEGLGAMPARGGCFECTDAQLKAAILYLLPELRSGTVKDLRSVSGD